MGIAIFTTWTMYGTWLPGDQRGWFEAGHALGPDELRQFAAELMMNEDSITLDLSQRQLVEKTIVDHCGRRKWTLHAVNCRSNHAHVVVTAPGRPIDIPREQFKAWCTRKLDERSRLLSLSPRDNWWTQRGWDVYIDDAKSLADVIYYVGQLQSAHGE